MGKLLVIDDEPQIRMLLSRMLELEGYEVLQASDGRSGFKQAKLHAPEVILCDVFLPDANGLEMVKTLKELLPKTEVILLTAHANIGDGVQSIKNGAFDYLIKGDDNAKIIPLVERAFSKISSSIFNDISSSKDRNTSFHSPKSIEFGGGFAEILGSSKKIQDAIALAQKVSATHVAVLLTGETGTGKEVFSKAIHSNGCRAKKAFVAVNCSAFSKDLLESEIFGYKAGSFTGASKDRKGLFEVADGGTLFLDEIGEMAFELQAKLLRVIESGEYIKVGDSCSTKVDVRIIAATNKNLEKEIKLGRFREDLFYRLSVFCIELPPLRQRLEDVRVLANFFIKRFALREGQKEKKMTEEYLEILKRQPWRGNIRELRNVIERSMIVSNSDDLLTQDLPVEMLCCDTKEQQAGILSDFELSQVESHHIARVLEYTEGNKTEAAKLLKIGLSTLYRKIEEYKL
ncbi:MAG: sigma-54 dependent transcriptional regulator [Bacteroidales bacterium]